MPPCQAAANFLSCAAVRVNETDTFADEEGLNDEYFDFEDISGGSCHEGPGSLPGPAFHTWVP